MDHLILIITLFNNELTKLKIRWFLQASIKQLQLINVINMLQYIYSFVTNTVENIDQVSSPANK